MRQNSSLRISNLLNCLRLLSLITAVCIVIGSLGFYSNHSIPLTVASDDDQQHTTSGITTTWILQTVSDRRLISTLVAAQASIFCPLFMLLSQSNTTPSMKQKANDEEVEEEPEKSFSHSTDSSSFLEMACQLLMPLGLALSWVFSILFDMKSATIMQYTQSSNHTMSVCLLQEGNNDCVFFDFIYGLKYFIVGLFAIESILAFCSSCTSRRIQLPLEEDEVTIVIGSQPLNVILDEK